MEVINKILFLFGIYSVQMHATKELRVTDMAGHELFSGRPEAIVTDLLQFRDPLLPTSMQKSLMGLLGPEYVFSLQPETLAGDGPIYVTAVKRPHEIIVIIPGDIRAILKISTDIDICSNSGGSALSDRVKGYIEIMIGKKIIEYTIYKLNEWSPWMVSIMSSYDIEIPNQVSDLSMPAISIEKLIKVNCTAGFVHFGFKLYQAIFLTLLANMDSFKAASSLPNEVGPNIMPGPGLNLIYPNDINIAFRHVSDLPVTNFRYEGESIVAQAWGASNALGLSINPESPATLVYKITPETVITLGELIRMLIEGETRFELAEE